MKFGTDGVRGRAHTDITVADASRLARAVARVFPSDAIVVGRDTRESGPAFVAALAAGFDAEATAVVDLGVAPTPEVAFAAADLGLAGVVVSASHNPWHDNGLKVFAPGGRKLDDGQQAAIEAELAHAEPVEFSGGADLVAGAESSHETARYLDHVQAALDGRSLAGLKVAIDCGNGAASTIGPELFAALGADVVILHADPDGRNINDGCGSTDLTDLRSAVMANSCDLGLAFDGDADRVLAVAGDGGPVDGDAIIALAAVDLHDHGRLAGDTVVVTVMSNLGFHRAMADHGIAVHTTSVGDRHVLDAIDRNGWTLGGEQSGHVIYRDRATTGDGLLTGALLADLVVRSSRSLADLASIVRPVPQFLVNVQVAGSSQEIVDALGSGVGAAERELAGQGRVLVRASGTEPVVRVMVEADDEAVARQIVDRLVGEVETIDRVRADGNAEEP